MAGLGAVVAEVSRLSLTALRRLQLVAEGSGTLSLAVRRWQRPAEATDFGHPTAAVSRWRVSALPSASLPSASLPLGGRVGALASGADALPQRRERGLRRGDL